MLFLNHKYLHSLFSVKIGDKDFYGEVVTLAFLKKKKQRYAVLELTSQRGSALYLHLRFYENGTVTGGLGGMDRPLNTGLAKGKWSSRLGHESFKATINEQKISITKV